MATKVNMLKFLQESRGFADFATRHPQARTPGPLPIPLRLSKAAGRRPKRVLHIAMQDQPDIPHPVPIRHLRSDRAD